MHNKISKKSLTDLNDFTSIARQSSENILKEDKRTQNPKKDEDMRISSIVTTHYDTLTADVIIYALMRL